MMPRKVNEKSTLHSWGQDLGFTIIDELASGSANKAGRNVSQAKRPPTT